MGSYNENLKIIFQKRIKINDFATAKNIVESQCKNWSQLKFQFACCYAMEELLEDERIFDKNRMRAFKLVIYVIRSLKKF